MINLIADGSVTKNVTTSNMTLAFYGDFGGGAVTVNVSFDEGTNWIPVEESAGVPLSITANALRNLLIEGRKQVRLTLAGATSPDLNITIA